MDDDELRAEVALYPLTESPATTPACEPQQPMPSGYIARAEWSEVMGMTHVQRKCRGCGLWLIWEPKGPAGDPAQS